MPRLWVPAWLARKSAPEEVIVYCDESGNSGPNYLDTHQPFYVLAGWVIPKDAVVRVSELVEEYRQKICPQAPELKSGAFLRGERQKHDATRFFKRMGQLGGVPLYLVAEKRFCVAGKIVETFLDPAFNPALQDAFAADIRTKQELANSFYDRFPEPVLTDFAQAYRSPSQESMRQALAAVIEASKSYLNPELAEVFQGCRSSLDKIAESELQDTELGSVSTTLNMPCLVSFLMMVENLGRIGAVRPLKVVHDHHHAYEEGYKRIFNWHQGLHDWFAPTPDHGLGYGGIANIPVFEVGDSRTVYAIQAADAFAGVVNHLFSLALSGNVPTSADRELANMMLGGLLVSEPRVTWAILSETCVAKLGETFIGKRDSASDPLAPFRTASVAKPALPPLTPAAIGKSSPKVGLPLYGIVGERTGALMMVNDIPYMTSPAALGLGDRGPVVLLFNKRTSAELVLSTFETLTEPQRIVEFDVTQSSELVRKLEEATRFTRVLTLDAGTDQCAHLYLPVFIDGFKKSLNRVLRLCTSGLANAVFKSHSFGNQHVYSMLTSDGRYIAMLGLEGTPHEGSTREAAVEAVKGAHGLLGEPTVSGGMAGRPQLARVASP